jgi:hypothetical protein
MKKLLTLLALVFCLTGKAQCPVTATAEYMIICNGMTDVLAASGATTCTWQPHTNIISTSITGDTVLIQPSTNTIYTVTGTTGTCTATNTVSVTVNNCTPPIVNFSKTADTICVGHCIYYKDSTQYTSTKPLTYTFVFQGGNITNIPTGSYVVADTLFYSITNNTPVGNIKVCYNVNSSLNENDPAHNIYGYYNVTEIVQNGIGQSNSKTDSVMVSGCVGIEQFATIKEQVNIYPNPNNGSFVIEPNSNVKQTLQVYDVNGKLVLSQTINGKTTIDASTLNEGVYNISLQSNEGVANKRLVIVR